MGNDLHRLKPLILSIKKKKKRNERKGKEKEKDNQESESVELPPLVSDNNNNPVQLAHTLQGSYPPILDSDSTPDSALGW